MKKFLNLKAITFIALYVFSLNEVFASDLVDNQKISPERIITSEVLSIDKNTNVVNELISFDLEVYKKIILESGISIETLSIDKNSVSKVINEEILDTKKNFLLIESKQVNDNFFNTYLQKKKYKLIIFICNSEYKESDIFLCDSNSTNFSFNSKNFNYESLKVYEYGSNNISQNTTFDIIKSENANILILKESFFESLDNRGDLVEYLSSLNKSLNVKIENPLVMQDTFKEKLNKFRESFTLEISYYIILNLLLFLFIGRIFVYLNSIYFSLKKISFSTLIGIIDELFFGVFKKNIFSRFFYLSFFSALGFITTLYLYSSSLLLGVSIKDALYLSINNFNNNILSNNLVTIFSQNKYDYLGFIALFYISLNLLIFSRVEIFMNYLKNILTNIKTKKLNLAFFSKLFVVLVLIVIFFTLYFSKYQEFEFLFLLLILMSFILGVLYKFNIDIKNSYSIKYKFIVSLISILLPIILLYLYSKEVTWQYEKLIGVKDKLVMLPYKKNLGENYLINNIDYEKFLNYPIFIDEYLIHYPGKTNINNLNVNDFSYRENFILVANEPEKIIEGILRNNNIIRNLSTNISTNLYYIENLENKSNNQLLVVDVDCRNITSKYFSYNLYYLENRKFRNNKVSKDIFLSCDENSKTYYFEIDTPTNSILDKNFIIEVSEKNSITNIQVVGDIGTNRYQNIANVYNFEINKNLYYYIKNITNPNSDIIYNYYTSSDKEYNFGNEPINERINKLIKDKVIERYFNVWSSEPLRLIKNQYD